MGKPSIHCTHRHDAHPSIHPSIYPSIHIQLQSSEQLLMQAEQLKRIHVLQDMGALNAEVDADTRALEARYVRVLVGV